MNVNILKWSDSRENLAYVVAKVSVESPVPGLIPPTCTYMPLDSFHTNESAIEWCLEHGHTIVIDDIAEAEE